jgi:ABC-2 type transporter
LQQALISIVPFYHSGLDSFSAIQVCHVLKKVANAGATVLFTIHQPSSDIFRSFDHLILLARGRVLYQGSVSVIPAYFAERGYPLPPNFNPADFVINCAQQFDIETLEQAGFFEPDNRHEREPNIPRAGQDFIGRKIQKRYQIQSERTAAVTTQTHMLFKRELSHMYRYPLPVQTRMGVTTFLSTLIGTMFWKVGNADQTNIFNLQSHHGGVMICLFFALLGAAQPALVSFPEERPIFLREYTTEHYSVTSYFLSRLLIEALLTGVQVLIMMLIIFYMMAFKGSFLMFYSATYALALAGTATAVWIGALAKGNVKSAQQLVPVILMPQLLFSGFFVSPSLMPFVLRWIQYICALTYAVKLLTLEEFTNCSDDFFQQQSCNLVIENIQANPDDKLQYWMLLVGMFLGFRLLALFQLKKSASEFY